MGGGLARNVIISYVPPPYALPPSRWQEEVRRRLQCTGLKPAQVRRRTGNAEQRPERAPAAAPLARPPLD